MDELLREVQAEKKYLLDTFRAYLLVLKLPAMQQFNFRQLKVSTMQHNLIER